MKGTAEEALKQINEKYHAQAFSADERKLIKIGVNFGNETRNIEKWTGRIKREIKFIPKQSKNPKRFIKFAEIFL